MVRNKNKTSQTEEPAMDTKQITIKNMDKAVWTKLRQLAIQEEVLVGTLVSNILKEYIEEREKKQQDQEQ